MLKRLTATIAVLGVFLMLGAGAALAATPSQIHRDLQDNGRLDHEYTAADLHKAFRNPAVQGDHKPTQPSPRIVQKATKNSPLRTSRKVGVLPFTVQDLTYIAAGAILLILVGGGLRVLARKN